MDRKVCTRCGMLLPLTDYSPDKRARDGRYSACRACNKAWRSTEYHRVYREKNADRIKEKNIAYQRDNSAVIRQRNHERYVANRDLKRQREQQRYAKNPAPTRARARAWARANPQRINERNRAWRIAHPDLARAHTQATKARRRSAEGSFTAAEWRAMCDRYGNVCLACGASGKLSADHIVPLSRGGSNTIENIQPLCLACNLRKATQIIDYRPDSPPVLY